MTYIKKLSMHGFKSFAPKTEINFDKGINVIVGPNGSGKCLTGDSLVQLADGSLERIEILVNSHLDSAVKTEDGFLMPGDGTKIMCLDMKTLKVTKKPIKAFVKRTSPSKLLSIKTRSGREITSTKYHPFFILRGGKVVAAKAEELKTGVKIAIPRNLGFSSEDPYMTELFDGLTLEDNVYVPYNEEFTIILKSLKKDLTWKELASSIGVPYYSLKGLLDKQAIHISNLLKILRCASLSEKEIARLITQIRANGKNTKFSFKLTPEFSRFFGYILAEGRLAKSSQIWFTNGNKEIVDDYVFLVKKLFNKNPLVREYKPNCWDVIIFSEPLKKILRILGMASNTGKKDISNIFLKHASNKDISNLLNGLYSGDGYISNSSIELTTKSSNLARKIETCLLRLGMIPRTKLKTKTIKSSGFKGEYSNISLFGVENFIKFNEHIPLKHKRKSLRIKENLFKKANPNLDLIEANELVKKIASEMGLNVKKLKKDFPRLDSYCYSQCTPSRHGLNLLMENVFQGKIQSSGEFTQLKSLSNSDIFWDELELVEEVKGTDWVYDLTVEDHHNFIANNIFAHNSNISDALCFVLGRLSIKSMRAAKAKNLLFMGSKNSKAAKEASVEIVFDNSTNTFALPNNEVSLKRIVRHNGQSIYKINNETKTRTEVLETLAQAGIDPHGFNLVLQGQIQAIVKMHPEERRKIIEEVAGISIYESRKEKSLKELDKTETRLKEISTILRERTAFLRNLEKERSQALKYKELETTIKKCKASILSKKASDKQKEIQATQNSMESKISQKDKLKQKSEQLQTQIDELNEKVSKINKYIQSATGLEQESLRNQISNLKAEIEGLRVRKENFENRESEIERRIEEMSKSIPEHESEIVELRKESPLVAKKQEELKRKKEELKTLEEEKRKVYSLKTELNSIKERIKDKNSQITKLNSDSDSLLKQIEEYSSQLENETRKACQKKINDLTDNLHKNRETLQALHEEQLELNKKESSANTTIQSAEETKSRIQELDVCPLCQNKMTSEHVSHVNSNSDEKIQSSKALIEEISSRMKAISEEKPKLEDQIESIRSNILKLEKELSLHDWIADKKAQLKNLVESESTLKTELTNLENKKEALQAQTSDTSRIDEKYSAKILEIEEISARTSEDLDKTLMYKERELEKIKEVIKLSTRDLQEVREEIEEISETIENKSSTLEKKEKEDQTLNEKFQKMFKERDSIQEQIQQKGHDSVNIQSEWRQIEDQVNYLKVGNAKLSAEKEAIEMELEEFSGLEIIKGSLEFLQDRLKKSQETLNNIGPINMRALEMYEGVKEEYDKVQEKVDTLDKEKTEILKIIEEIDKKKKRTFMKTFKGINELFKTNFSRLFTKGQAFLELENKEDLFSGGVNIAVKFAKGKHFDVTSLSGGEQTMIAVSLLFAIQEFRPYHFYILDEIDAALDKRNSERLSGLLRKYMQQGQYIVVTHNDALIMDSNLLYGISMHEGISKVLGLKLD